MLLEWMSKFFGSALGCFKMDFAVTTGWAVCAVVKNHAERRDGVPTQKCCNEIKKINGLENKDKNYRFTICRRLISVIMRKSRF